MLSFYTEDSALVGPEQLFEIEAFSEDYPDVIEPVKFYGKVTVLPCDVLELFTPEGGKPFSPLYPIFELPDAFTI